MERKLIGRFPKIAYHIWTDATWIKYKQTKFKHVFLNFIQCLFWRQALTHTQINKDIHLTPKWAIVVWIVRRRQNLSLSSVQMKKQKKKNRKMHVYIYSRRHHHHHQPEYLPVTVYIYIYNFYSRIICVLLISPSHHWFFSCWGEKKQYKYRVKRCRTFPYTNAWRNKLDDCNFCHFNTQS